MDDIKQRKQAFIKAFRDATQKHTHRYTSCIHENDSYDYPYPIPFGKFTIDEDFGKREINIRCKKCWTDDLLIVAKKVAAKFNAKVSDYLSMGGFGTTYNFFTISF